MQNSRYNTSMNWALKRRLVYVSLFLGIIVIILSIIIVPHLKENPSCFDLKQNGQEEGVDCGGPCDILCKNKIIQPLVLWSRSYKVTDNIYNAAAYIENQNPRAYGYNASYSFRLYDKDNILITERKGTTFINPNGRQLIFESTIDVGTRVPLFTRFSIDNVDVWYKTTINPSTFPIKIDSPSISVGNNVTKVMTKISNTSLDKLPSFYVGVIGYDQSENAVLVSKTKVDELEKESSAPLVFTWSESNPNINRFIFEPTIDAFSPLIRK